jgi:amidase
LRILVKRLTRDRTVPLGQRYRVTTPVLTIDSGETIVVETINHMTPVVWGEEDLHPHGSPGYREREETGPIYVRGAEPGDMLAVHVDDIQFVGLPHAHAARHPLVERYPQQPMVFPIQGDRCQLPGDVRVPVSPMIGDIYTTPQTPCFFDQGGNMDFTDVKPGNTLYLPVYREGGLLVLGDVHAAQGDGEIYGEGAECAADVTITVAVEHGFRSPRPVVETVDDLICLAGRSSMWESLRLALTDMTGLLSHRYGLSENDAYVLCSMTGSARLAACLAREEWIRECVLIALSVPKDFEIGTSG